MNEPKPVLPHPFILPKKEVPLWVQTPDMDKLMDQEYRKVYEQLSMPKQTASGRKPMQYDILLGSQKEAKRFKEGLAKAYAKYTKAKAKP